MGDARPGPGDAEMHRTAGEVGGDFARGQISDLDIVEAGDGAGRALLLESVATVPRGEGERPLRMCAAAGERAHCTDAAAAGWLDENDIGTDEVEHLRADLK